MSDLQFADWLEQRFPDERGLQRRIRDRRLLLIVLWLLLQPVAVLAVVPLYRRFDADTLRLVDQHPWLRLPALLLLAVGVVLVGVGMVKAARAGETRQRPTSLQALTARQRRLLRAELLGRRPAPPEDLPVLRHLATGWTWTTGLVPAAVGFALVVVASALLLDVGPYYTSAALALLLGLTVAGLRRARAGAAFLERTATPGTGPPRRR